MTRSASDSPAARALRDAGYVKLPGWWVTLENGVTMKSLKQVSVGDTIYLNLEKDIL